MQLFTPISINIIQAASAEMIFNENNDSQKDIDDLNKEDQVAAAAGSLFDDPELQNIWIQGVTTDKDWRRARDSVQSSERAFPTDIVQKLNVKIGECSVGADNILRGRESRIWVPDGHPGGDTMISILLRRWFWPKMRDSVRRFIQNCDTHGRSTVWREAKAGFLKPLPVPERIGSDLTIDFVTDLPESKGCSNIMVITDRCRLNGSFKLCRDIR